MRRYLSVLFISVLCILLTGCGISENDKTYQKGIDYLNNSEYENAIIEFYKISDYKDSKDKLQETYYKYAKNEIDKQNYDNALKLLENCKSYKDSDELLKETTYLYAKSLLDSKGKEAIVYFEKIKDYKDSELIIENYNKEHKFDGTYSDKGSSGLGYQGRYIINGLPNKIIKYSYDTKENNYGDDKYSKGYYGVVNLELNCNEDYTTCTSEDNNYIRTYIFGNDKVIYKTHNKNPKSWELNYVDMETTFYKISDDTELPQERTKVGSAKPQIGMTAEEVKKSSWGNPKKINKSTYEWGTTEQWVYSDNRYVYFKNGKVTSISE